MGAAEVIGRVLRPEGSVCTRMRVVQVLSEAPVRVDGVTEKFAGVFFQGAHSFFSGAGNVIWYSCVDLARCVNG